MIASSYARKGEEHDLMGGPHRMRSEHRCEACGTAFLFVRKAIT